MGTTARASLLPRHRIQGSGSTYGHHGAQRAHPSSHWADSNLSILVLKTAAERSVIKKLRFHAPIEAESDLDSDAFDLDELKDRLGIVMAILRCGEVIATIRFVPSGHGVTLAEKSWGSVTSMLIEYGRCSWEVGRLIVEPKHRSAALLPQCLALACTELIKASDVEYLHASCSPLMARLYRRFGFATETVTQGGNGLQHALIRAHIDDVARALHVLPDKNA